MKEKFHSTTDPSHVVFSRKHKPVQLHGGRPRKGQARRCPVHGGGGDVQQALGSVSGEVHRPRIRRKRVEHGRDVVRGPVRGEVRQGERTHWAAGPVRDAAGADAGVPEGGGDAGEEVGGEGKEKKKEKEKEEEVRKGKKKKEMHKVYVRSMETGDMSSGQRRDRRRDREETEVEEEERRRRSGRVGCILWCILGGSLGAYSTDLVDLWNWQGVLVIGTRDQILNAQFRHFDYMRLYFSELTEVFRSLEGSRRAWLRFGSGRLVESAESRRPMRKSPEGGFQHEGTDCFVGTKTVLLVLRLFSLLDCFHC